MFYTKTNIFILSTCCCPVAPVAVVPLAVAATAVAVFVRGVAATAVAPIAAPALAAAVFATFAPVPVACVAVQTFAVLLLFKLLLMSLCRCAWNPRLLRGSSRKGCGLKLAVNCANCRMVPVWFEYQRI